MTPHIVYYVASSLDGYIATPDGGVGWLDPFMTPGEDYGYSAFLKSVDAILIGSRTYEQSLSFGAWPYTGMPCFIFTKRTLRPASKDIVFLSRAPRDEMIELQRKKINRAWLMGGAQLASSFRAEGLISEYIISFIPLTLGDGVPLFGSPGPQESLRLIDTKSFANGIVQLHYGCR